jgi:hypothetical protein
MEFTEKQKQQEKHGAWMSGLRIAAPDAGVFMFRFWSL